MSNQHQHLMSNICDRESLLAAWKAIGPCQPLPQELEGILLTYFEHAQLHGEMTISMPGLELEHTDQPPPPPTRFIRQPRANRKAPLGPPGSKMCTTSQEPSTIITLDTRREPPAPALRSSLSLGGMDVIANGPRGENIE